MENYVSPKDIPLIRSLAKSSTHRWDTFYWNYTRNSQYTVNLGYWVAHNLLNTGEEKEVLEPSITKLQAFAWKIKVPKKICHFIWQMITCHLAVTRNLVRRNMRCDDYCPRCGEPEESVTHSIFECPPAIQVWSLSVIPGTEYLREYELCFMEEEHHCRTRTRHGSLSLDYMIYIESPEMTNSSGE